METLPTATADYQVRWDGRSPVGSELASGVYIVRLRAGDATEERKIVLAE